MSSQVFQAIFDLEVFVFRQGGWRLRNHTEESQVLQDVPIQYRKLVAPPDVSQEVACFLVAESHDVADKPFAGPQRVAETGDGSLDRDPAIAEELPACRRDVRGLVPMKPDAFLFLRLRKKTAQRRVRLLTLTISPFRVGDGN
jgi:hypothetical protein